MKKSEPDEQTSAAESCPPFAVFVGIDWGDRTHAFCELSPGGEILRRDEFEQSPNSIDEFVERLRTEYPNAPIAIAVEQSRGALAYALIERLELTVFAVNPKSAAFYREALAVSGKKDDPTDAEYLALQLCEHHPRMTPIQLDSIATQRIDQLSKVRRKLVESRKKAGQQLTALLKEYFPAALVFGGGIHSSKMLGLLSRWPNLKALQRARPQLIGQVLGRKLDAEALANLVREIRAARPLCENLSIIEPNSHYAQALATQLKSFNNSIDALDKKLASALESHEDAAIYQSLPGAGAALAPRILAALGDDRERYDSAANLASASGTAPVVRQSGRSRSISMRHACNKYLRQTFQEFAEHARRYSSWSKAFYDQQRSLGKRHNAAVRALAYKWIRIIFRLWQNREKYDEQQHLATLRKKNAPCLKFLEPA